MKNYDPATINKNRYILLIDWNIETGRGITTMTLDAETLRAAQKEVENQNHKKGWYLAQILERQNDVGVIDVDTPDDYQWLYRPVLERRADGWHIQNNDWSGVVVTWHEQYKVRTAEITNDAAQVAHMMGCAE